MHGSARARVRNLPSTDDKQGQVGIALKQAIQEKELSIDFTCYMPLIISTTAISSADLKARGVHIRDISNVSDVPP